MAHSGEISKTHESKKLDESGKQNSRQTWAHVQTLTRSDHTSRENQGNKSKNSINKEDIESGSLPKHTSASLMLIDQSAVGTMVEDGDHKLAD